MKDELLTKMETLDKEHKIMRDRLHDLSGGIHADANRITVLEEKSDIHRVAINGLDKDREKMALELSVVKNDNIHTTKFIESISESLDNFTTKFEDGIKEIVAEIAKLKENNSSWNGMASVLKVLGYLGAGSAITYLFEHIK